MVRDHLLLVERGRQPARGQWSVPGGRVEGGETLAAAVERELLEETGLRVVCGEFIGWVERVGPQFHFVIMDFHVELAERLEDSDPLPLLTAADDAAEAAWLPLEALDSVPLVGGLTDFLRAHEIVE